MRLAAVRRGEERREGAIRDIQIRSGKIFKKEKGVEVIMSRYTKERKKERMKEGRNEGREKRKKRKNVQVKL